MSLRVVSVFLLLSITCRAPTTPENPELIRVKGTVHFMTVEGGFWAVRGDDNVTYDPINGVPQAFQTEGLRVRLEAKPRQDAASIHMAGPLVEIVTIAKIGS